MFAVDGFGADVTLLDASWRGGGGRDFALGRQAVAAILNAAHPDVDYLFTTEDVIDQVAAAFGTTDQEALKDVLESENERGCTVMKRKAPQPILGERARVGPHQR